MSGSFREVGPGARAIAIVLAMAASVLPGTLGAASLPELSPPPKSTRFT